MPRPCHCSTVLFRSVQQFTGLALDLSTTPTPPPHPSISLFIPNSLPGFFPCLFSQIHKPQQFQIPWLCSFSKPHIKNKLITPPTHEITLRKHKQKENMKKKMGGLFYISPPPFCIESRQRGITAALSALEPDLSMPTVWCQSDEKAAGGYSQNDSVGWEPDLKRR